MPGKTVQALFVHFDKKPLAESMTVFRIRTQSKFSSSIHMRTIYACDFALSVLSKKYRESLRDVG